MPSNKKSAEFLEVRKTCRIFAAEIIKKIWIEKNGQQSVEIAESQLSAKDNEMLGAAINRHWKFINEQITRTFNGEKTIAIDIEK